METKREGEGQATGRAQIEIWVAAHFNRLQEIACDGAKELPFLPLLLTQGPVWSLLFAHRQREGQGWVTIIYEKVTLGDVTTPSGVFKVMSSLLLLMHWAQIDFRPCGLNGYAQQVQPEYPAVRAYRTQAYCSSL
ncbi:hypothetical protein LTR56_027892 [Elasticomyces elasticus]|nr:hypothetical protein LTR56_027892 [Elasticomyces elasticus]KAK4898566.1 hypothetical protein LTR49_027780 [Elasticomyces elasticus]